MKYDSGSESVNVEAGWRFPGSLLYDFPHFCMYMKISIIKYLKKKKRLDLIDGETGVVNNILQKL